MSELSDDEIREIESTPAFSDDADSQSGKDVPRSPHSGPDSGGGAAQTQA